MNGRLFWQKRNKRNTSSTRALLGPALSSKENIRQPEEKIEVVGKLCFSMLDRHSMRRSGFLFSLCRRSKTCVFYQFGGKSTYFRFEKCWHTSKWISNLSKCIPRGDRKLINLSCLPNLCPLIYQSKNICATRTRKGNDWVETLLGVSSVINCRACTSEEGVVNSWQMIGGHPQTNVKHLWNNFLMITSGIWSKTE